MKRRKRKSPVVVHVRTTNPTVLLGPAYVWQCPLCSEINFDTPRHLRHGQYECVCDAIGNVPEEKVYRNPDAVECASCGKIFRSIANSDGDRNLHVVVDADDADSDNADTGMDLLQDTEDWSDGEP